MLIRNKSRRRGYLLVELLVGAAIVAGALVALVGAVNQLAVGARENVAATQAGFLAEEGLEAARLWRDTSWDNKVANLSLGQNYYLVWNSNRWEASVTPSLIDGKFSRVVEVSSAYRDGNNNLVENGTLDSEARLITTTVGWASKNGTSTRELSTYLTNIFDN